MSHVFDATMKVWRDHIRPFVPNEMLAEEFEQVLGAIHEANHRVPSADGLHKGDGLNHDPQLNRAVRDLVEFVEEQDRSGGWLERTRMTWRAVIDDKTCPGCKALDGFTVDERMPPYPHCENPDGCRCVAEPTKEEHEEDRSAHLRRVVRPASAR